MTDQWARTVRLVALTAVTLACGIARADRGTMLVFSESGNNLPQYAFWDGDAWDDERDSSSIGAEAYFVMSNSRAIS